VDCQAHLSLGENMQRREFISLLGGAASWPLAARAQQAERMQRVGVLIAGLTEKDSEGQLRMAAFRLGLQNLGWIEGRNVHIEERWPGGNNERLRGFTAELVGMRPDVIFAGNEAATMAVHQTASTLPIVFAQVGDPVANGLVASIARPGGNLTGFALWEYGFAAKWGEVLREIAPRTVRVGVIYDPANAMQRLLPDLERTLLPGMQVVAISVSSRSDLENAIERIAMEPNGALIVFAGPLAVAHRDLMITLAVKHRLPLLYPYRYFTAAGGLISYGPDLVDQYRLAASYVDRILKGEKPADLPVQFPTKYMLVINLKTAKALGLTVPDKLLALADEVIQ
jgi:putative ABC transport system substrate-binding protein